MPDDTFHLPHVTAYTALMMHRDGATLVDLRKAPARVANGQTVVGSLIKDPFSFGHSDALTTTDGPIVVYCVHGHEVSQYGCALLRVHGRDAHYVVGGFDALVAAGAPMEQLP